jgi:uncharacterized protein YutE (UPF0331/DUF86 family)
MVRRFLGEAWEALRAARGVVEGYTLEEFMSRMEARYALRYALILLVEAVVDVLVAILEADYGLAPESYREAVLLAGERGVIPYSAARRLAQLASLRNMLVHRYWRVDDERLYRETRIGLQAVEEVLGALEEYVSASDP